MKIPQASDLLQELMFSSSRSGGPGGQNVNKVNSKVTIKWDIVNSRILTTEQREMLLKKLSVRLTKGGILLLTAQEKRTQLQNKEVALFKLDKLLIKSLTPRKARKATKPGKGAVRKRIDDKKHHSEKKQWRKPL